MVGGDHVDGAVQNACDEGILIRLAAQRGIHFESAVLLQVHIGQYQIMRACFAGNRKPFFFRLTDELNTFFGGDVADVIVTSCFSHQGDVTFDLLPFTFGADTFVSVLRTIFACMNIAAIEQFVDFAVCGYHFVKLFDFFHSLAHHFVTLYTSSIIGKLWNWKEVEVFNLRKEQKMFPVYKMIETSGCGGYIPYFYSTYEEGNESRLSDKKKIIVLGSGPIRIGQGVEFDYSTVHAVTTIKQYGYESIIINNNPETVSTDYTTSDKLYFEPLTTEDVMNIVEMEQPLGVIASLGGQTAINLAQPLMERGVKIIGTDVAAIERAENRDSFEKIMEELHIPQPKGQAVTNIEDGVKAAEEIGYPVLVRPSYVLGGRAMQIVANEESLRSYLKTAVKINEDQPVLVDKYIQGKELEVDAVCDGYDVFVPGIMEHVERTGVHSGDSISVYPTFSVSAKAKGTILEYTKKLGLGIGIRGLFNIQFIVDKNDDVYVIEVNPRSSRTVPFLSKATGYSLADIATLVILGKTLKEQGIFGIYPDEKNRWYVKVPAFSFSKLHGMDTYLSPEMKSTGEAIGYDNKLNRALYKALQASGMNILNYGTVFATIADKDKEEALPLIRRFYELGFNIEATKGTAEFLKEHGIRTRVRAKISDGSDEIIESIRHGYVSYVINTRDINDMQNSDGWEIRQCAVENNVTMFTALDTVRVLLDVLEETTLCISTIDA